MKGSVWTHRPGINAIMHSLYGVGRNDVNKQYKKRRKKEIAKLD